MSNVTILDSSGQIRHPDRDKITDENKEEIRDMFFNSIYIYLSEKTVHLNFYASTGTPEQFVGVTKLGDRSNAIKTAHDRIKREVESELNWSLADPDASEGHRLFSSIDTIQQQRIDRYSIDALRAATRGDNWNIDLGTPDIESAVGVLLWLVEAGPPNWDIVISPDGRSAVVDDADIVIIPGVTEESVIGVDGSDETIQQRYVDTKANFLRNKLLEVVPRMEEGTPVQRRQTALANLEFLANYTGKDYIIERRQKIKDRIRDQSTLGMSIIGFFGFIFSFFFGGGLRNFTQWWTDSILNGPAVQLFTISRVYSIFGAGEASLNPQSVLGVGVVLIVAWISLIVYLKLSSKSQARETSAPDSATVANSPHFTDAVDSVAEATENYQWASVGDVVDVLDISSQQIPSDVVFQPESIEKRERLLQVAGWSVASGVVFGFFGLIFGRYLENLLQFYPIIVETILLISLLGTLVGLGLLIKELV